MKATKDETTKKEGNDTPLENAQRSHPCTEQNKPREPPQEAYAYALGILTLLRPTGKEGEGMGRSGKAKGRG